VSLPAELERALAIIKANAVEKLDSGWIFNCDNRLVFEALPDDSIDLIITDPPYKDYQSNRPVAHEKVKKIHESDFDLPFFIEQSARVLKPGAHFYCWCDHLTFPGIVAEMERQKVEKLESLKVRKGNGELNFLTYKNMLVWVKNNHGSGDLKGNYAPQHELVIFGCKGAKGRDLIGKRQPNVYFRRDSITDEIKFFSKVPNTKHFHGTSKPVTIQRLMIRRSSSKREIIFDPYAGSMSTGMAAVRDGRQYILTEIEQSHYIAGVARLTGNRSFELE
jgi:site-specific DNA-methyltransferase (adenine-specific)